VGNIYRTLFPSLHHFRSKTVLGQIASVFAAPAVMLLTLTLPVVVTPYESRHHSHEKTPGQEDNLIDFEEEGVERILIAEEEVEEEMHGMPFNKWLTAVQCICGPLFCAAVLFGNAKQVYFITSTRLILALGGNAYQIWAMVSAAIAGFVASILVVMYANHGTNPAFRMTRCSMGFLVAVVWIMAIADEVVKVLQVYDADAVHLSRR
jgi:sodium/potassium/calcium exchanger 6